MATGTEPLPPSYQRLHGLGHHSHVLSEPEMEWICWTAAMLGFFFVMVAIWSHHDARKLPRKPLTFRSYTKRRNKRRKRHRK